MNLMEGVMILSETEVLVEFCETCKDDLSKNTLTKDATAIYIRLSHNALAQQTEVIKNLSQRIEALENK